MTDEDQVAAMADTTVATFGRPAGFPGRVASHAVLGLTSSAALEHAPRGIRSNAVSPAPPTPPRSPT